MHIFIFIFLLGIFFATYHRPVFLFFYYYYANRTERSAGDDQVATTIMKCCLLGPAWLVGKGMDPAYNILWHSLATLCGIQPIRSA